LADGSELHYGTAVALGERAVLLRGAAGAGKSDLALRLIMDGAAGVIGSAIGMLVADDQVKVERRGEAIVLSPPNAIAGKLEVRGLGILDVVYRPEARLGLLVDLVARESVPRMPEAGEHELILGLVIPRIRLWAFEPSAAIKVALALWATPDNGSL
jgi:serine kinase of HPr protein (carbohydrate metabolism regulator)